MALKLTLENLDGLNEAQKPLYVERDGKFHLDVDGIEDTSGLKSALEKERTARRDFEKKYGQLKDVDPEEYARLKKEAEDRATADAEKKGQFDDLRARLVEKHKAELDAVTGKVTAMQSALEKHLVDAVATAAIAEAKGVPALLLPHVKASVKVVEVNGQYTVQVVDANGNERIMDGKGTPMTIADLVADMKKDEIFGRAFEGSGASGAGTHPSSGHNNNAKSMPRGQFFALSPQAQGAHVKGGGIVTD
ncbi:MAG: hypothetical protein HQK81_12350 [Desulfovibrionaceae bacterium]|nr:hypothetical protein [Desulfovibrionaceae bacterium]MBF0514834.1 hypothetical protein [Desulfovibrionaceae bacterium]